MTSEETSLDVLLETRDQLISEIRSRLDEPSKTSLLSPADAQRENAGKLPPALAPVEFVIRGF